MALSQGVENPGGDRQAGPAGDPETTQSEGARPPARRPRRGGSAYAWCDLAGGRPSQVDLFARAVAADDPSPWENGLRLPAALAVGHNRLVLKHPDPALSARLGGETMTLDGTGEITFTVPDRGPVDVELVAGGGEVIAGYHADVPRPLLVSAHEPFLPAEAERFSLDVVLNVTGTDCVPVTVTATGDEGGESVTSFELAPGRHAVDMSLPPGGTGEVTVEVEALVGVGAPEGAGPLATAPAGDDVLRLKARHWFAVGLSAEELDVYREGLRGEEADPTADGELAFSHGLIVRRQGFQYGLSTVSLPPINGPFRLDPQNVVELLHRDAGCILNAANSCHQPEAGTFFRRTSQAELGRSPTAPRTVYMPTTVSIARLPDGYDLSLSYWGFNARLAVRVLSPTEAKLVVTPQFGGGEEPVVFNFFPGVRRAEELTVNGPVLHFRGVTIEGCGPFQVDRDFRIWNPYQQEFTYTHKPVRCWVEFGAEETFVLDVRLQGE